MGLRAQLEPLKRTTVLVGPSPILLATIDIFHSYVCLLTGQVTPTQLEGAHRHHPEDAKEILQLGSHPGERALRQPAQCAASLTRHCAVLSAVRHLPCGTQDCIGSHHFSRGLAWMLICWGTTDQFPTWLFWGRSSRRCWLPTSSAIWRDMDLVNECNRDTRVCTVLRQHYCECTLTYCALW